jgi:hypothetical protein
MSVQSPVKRSRATVACCNAGLASCLHVARAACRDRARSSRTRATIRPATRTIPRTIQPQGVEELDVVTTVIVVELDSTIEVVVGGGVVVGAPVVVVVVGGAVVGAPVVGVVVGGAVVGAPVAGAVVEGSATEGLLVGVDGDPMVVLGLLAGGFVDPEPPHALSVSATAPPKRRAGK